MSITDNIESLVKKYSFTQKTVEIDFQLLLFRSFSERYTDYGISSLETVIWGMNIPEKFYIISETLNIHDYESYYEFLRVILALASKYYKIENMKDILRNIQFNEKEDKYFHRCEVLCTKYGFYNNCMDFYNYYKVSPEEKLLSKMVTIKNDKSKGKKDAAYSYLRNDSDLRYLTLDWSGQLDKDLKMFFEENPVENESIYNIRLIHDHGYYSQILHEELLKKYNPYVINTIAKSVTLYENVIRL
nr:hypothetical protein [Artemisia fimovirus 1]